MNGWLTEVKPPYDAKKLEEVKNFHITKAVETVTPKKCEIKPADEKEEFQIVLWDFGAKGKYHPRADQARMPRG